MKIIKNKWFPFGGYKAINLFGLVFTKSELSDVDKNHEAIHTRQMIECFILGLIIMIILIGLTSLGWIWILSSIPFYYIWYAIEYIIIYINNLDDTQNEKYHEVSFEEEAYNYDSNLAYLRFRKPFSWLKYLGIHSNE